VDLDAAEEKIEREGGRRWGERERQPHNCHLPCNGDATVQKNGEQTALNRGRTTAVSESALSCISFIPLTSNEFESVRKKSQSPEIKHDRK
jgi:hypothetical protein